MLTSTASDIHQSRPFRTPSILPMEHQSKSSGRKSPSKRSSCRKSSSSKSRIKDSSSKKSSSKKSSSKKSSSRKSSSSRSPSSRSSSSKFPAKDSSSPINQRTNYTAEEEFLHDSDTVTLHDSDTEPEQTIHSRYFLPKTWIGHFRSAIGLDRYKKFVKYIIVSFRSGNGRIEDVPEFFGLLTADVGLDFLTPVLPYIPELEMQP